MDYIAHYGTLGMKWGVRKYQNLDGTYTEEGRKRYGIGSPLYSETTKGVQRGRVDHNNPEHPDLKKGTRLYRVSSKQDDSDKKRLYVTYDEATDRNYYLSGIWNPTASKILYEQYLEPVKDLKVASLPRVSKESADIYGNDPVKICSAYCDALMKTRFSGEPVALIKAYAKWDGTAKSVKDVKIHGMSSQAISDKLSDFGVPPKKQIEEHLQEIYKYNPSQMYRDAADAVNTDPKAQKLLTDRLKKQGYQAQVDAAGLGSFDTGQNAKERKLAKTRGHVYGSTANDPLIIFDNKTNLRVRAAPEAIAKKVQTTAGMIEKTSRQDRIRLLPKSQKSIEKQIDNTGRLMQSTYKRVKAAKTTGMSNKQIAKMLGISESAVYYYLNEFND